MAMTESSNKVSARWLVFGLALLVALGWAVTTSHVWEDYYITYRSSRNLATGHGLVFNVGEKLHTFTSPLGVLLPALASWLTGTQSDAAAIWLFRMWSAAAFAGAAVLVWTVARRFQYGRFAAAALVAFVVLDGKGIDFSVNGMETGFLLLFLAYTLWAMFACTGRQWLHLGLAWGALMWTRPDSFLYVGLLSAGVFFFNDASRTGLTRGQWLKLFLQAGAVCTLVYLPWLLWAWWYYGTPIPHTITAKGAVSGVKPAWGVLKTLIDFPLTVWTGSTSLESTFLPSYFQIGGWPSAAVTTARWVALLLAFQWAVPLWRVEVRVASFAFCGMHAYLSYFPYFPFPWYLPGPALLGAVTLGAMIAQLLAVAKRPWLRAAILIVTLVALGAQGWLTWQMRREMALEQRYSGTGTRQRAGEWLKAHAKPGDTVFMEPLGYIGYFSGLRTYDYPGLSSMEMVYAIHALASDGGNQVEFMCPDWIVLRPWEYVAMHTSIFRLFGKGYSYELVHEINNLPQVQQLDVYGRKYIEFDSDLLIFKRQVPKRYLVDPTTRAPFDGLGLPGQVIGGQLMYQVHATGILSVRVPASAKHFRISFGLPEATYRGTPVTDGVEFTVKWMNGMKAAQLASRYLDPAARPEDRGAQVFEGDLPPHGEGAALILITRSGPTDPMDWSCWTAPVFK